MENYIVINGKRAELTPEQLKALGIETEKDSPFKCEKEQDYYFISTMGNITRANYNTGAQERHSVANYCTDPDLMNQRALHETLNRLLWRYSMEHKGNEIDWNNKNIGKYVILYDHECKNWEIDIWHTYQWVGAVHFYDEKIAQNAIKDIVEPFMAEHPEFKW